MLLMKFNGYIGSTRSTLHHRRGSNSQIN